MIFNFPHQSVCMLELFIKETYRAFCIGICTILIRTFPSQEKTKIKGRKHNAQFSHKTKLMITIAAYSTLINKTTIFQWSPTNVGSWEGRIYAALPLSCHYLGKIEYLSRSPSPREKTVQIFLKVINK